MTETEFKNEIKKGLAGGYLFYGDEDFLKYKYAIQAKNSILDGVFDAFNHYVLYPENYSAEALRDAITTAPMMAEKKLVELYREADSETRKAVLNYLKGDKTAMMGSLAGSLLNSDGPAGNLIGSLLGDSKGETADAIGSIFEMLGKTK